MMAKTIGSKFVTALVIVTMMFTTTCISTGNIHAAEKAGAKAKVLRHYALAGYYDKELINGVKMDNGSKVRIWDPATKKFGEKKDIKCSNIVGNYVKICDTDSNKKGDLVYVVKYKDGTKKWNPDVQWIKGAGEKTEPVVSNSEGQRMYVAADYRIPMGERLLEGFGLQDYSGTTDLCNHFKGYVYQQTYWPDVNAYNLKSSENLTILPNYRTYLQTIGTSCSLASAVSVLDWYGERGDLNDRDLSSLRKEDRVLFSDGTWPGELENVFKRLAELEITCDWTIESSYDSEEAAYNITNPEWIIGHLEKGHPIMVGWNSFDSHEQVIIGYDTMGSEDTADDVIIMMDPYDTTDHNSDGYIIQPAERLMYGLSDYKETKLDVVQYVVAYPADGESDWSYDLDRTGAGLADNLQNELINNDDYGKLNDKVREQTAKDLSKYYKNASDDWKGVVTDGVGGAWGVERGGDYNNSPYFFNYDYYNYESGVTKVPTETLLMIPEFKTVQQSSEWTCGCASMLMTLDYLGYNEDKDVMTDAYLSSIRQDGKEGCTYLKGMEDMVKKVNSNLGDSQDKLLVLTRNDLDDIDSEESYIGDYCLQAGTDPEWPGLIPYLIENNIPVMIGSDEWGGHWQVIVGYDDMGTIADTQDDVLVIADPYDTTDHNQDGYVIKGFERLAYGWNVQYEDDGSKYAGGFDHNDFIVVIPDSDEYEGVIRNLGL